MPLPLPEPIKYRPVHWKVLNEPADAGAIKPISGAPAPSTATVVYFGLSPADYQALSLQTADTLRWIRQATFQLKRGSVK